MSAHPASEQTRRRFRSLIGRFATGVTVISVMHEGALRAMTINSLASVSLDPLVVLFCVRNASSMLYCLPTRMRFGINVLAAGQELVARRHAGQIGAAASSESWTMMMGCPVLEGAVASFVCDVRERVQCGDHHVIFADVIEMHESSDVARALLFVAGRFDSAALLAPAPAPFRAPFSRRRRTTLPTTGDAPRPICC